MTPTEIKDVIDIRFGNPALGTAERALWEIALQLAVANERAATPVALQSGYSGFYNRVGMPV